MLIGAHCSGGVKASVEKAAGMGADALQLFTQSPRAWKPPNPDPERYELFREQREKAGKTSIEQVREFVPYTKGAISQKAP